MQTGTRSNRSLDVRYRIVDMKLMDPERHKYYTGVDNALITEVISKKQGKKKTEYENDHKKAIDSWSK